MSEILTKDLTESIVNGTGIFDELMKATSAHLNAEYQKNRIKGSDYAKVYIAGMESVMAQSVQYLLGRQQADHQAELTNAQRLKTIKETLHVVQQTKNAVADEDKTRQEIINLKTQDILTYAQISKTKEETILVKEQVLKVTADWELVNAKTLTEAKMPKKVSAETDLIKVQNDKVVQETVNLVTQELLIRQQIAKLDIEMDLLKESIVELQAKIGLVLAQTEKTTKEVELVEKQIDLAQQQIIKLIEEIKLLQAKLAIEIEQLQKMYAEISLITTQVELTKQKICTELAQTNGSPTAFVSNTYESDEPINTLTSKHAKKEPRAEIVNPDNTDHVSSTDVITTAGCNKSTVGGLIGIQIDKASREILILQEKITTEIATATKLNKEGNVLDKKVLTECATAKLAAQKIRTEVAQTSGNPTPFNCTDPSDDAPTPPVTGEPIVTILDEKFTIEGEDKKSTIRTVDTPVLKDGTAPVSTVDSICGDISAGCNTDTIGGVLGAQINKSTAEGLVLKAKIKTETSIRNKLTEEKDLIILKQWTEKAQVQSTPIPDSIAGRQMKLQNAQIDAFCNDVRVKSAKAGIGPLMAQIASDPNWTDDTPGGTANVHSESKGCLTSLSALASSCIAKTDVTSDDPYKPAADEAPGKEPVEPAIKKVSVNKPDVSET